MQNYLSTDLKRVSEVFGDALYKFDEFPHVYVQAAQGIEYPPLAADAKPVLYEVYLDGSEEAVLTLHGSNVVAGDLKKMANFEAIVLEIDGIYRYAAIGDTMLCDSMGDHELPTAIATDPVAMATWITQA